MRHRPTASGRHDVRGGRAGAAQRAALPADRRAPRVVDPEVGAERRAIAVRAQEGRIFVGPDNGLLSLAVEADGGAVEAVDVRRSPLRLEPVSATFHGRDIFAPVAAHLAAGAPLAEAGDPLDVWPSSWRSSCRARGSSDGTLVAHVLARRRVRQRAARRAPRGPRRLRAAARAPGAAAHRAACRTAPRAVRRDVRRRRAGRDCSSTRTPDALAGGGGQPRRRGCGARPRARWRAADRAE